MAIKPVNESMEGGRVGACCWSGGEMLPGGKVLRVRVLGLCRRWRCSAFCKGEQG